jgi:hypothetical protein
MQIYNADANRNKTRFIEAIGAGLLASIVLGTVYGIVVTILPIQMQIMYLAVGYGIGMVIQKVGHGLTKKFCVIGAVFTFLAIVIGDSISIFGIQTFFANLLNPSAWVLFLQTWISLYLSTNINTILGLIFRVMGIYIGYHYAVIF